MSRQTDIATTSGATYRLSKVEDLAGSSSASGDLIVLRLAPRSVSVIYSGDAAIPARAVATWARSKAPGGNFLRRTCSSAVRLAEHTGRAVQHRSPLA